MPPIPIVGFRRFALKVIASVAPWDDNAARIIADSLDGCVLPLRIAAVKTLSKLMEKMPFWSADRENLLEYITAKVRAVLAKTKHPDLLRACAYALGVSSVRHQKFHSIH